MDTFIDRLRGAMMARSLSFADLARAAGVTPESLYVGSKNPNWRPRPATLALYAKALGTTPEFLLTGLNSPQNGAQASEPAMMSNGFATAPVYSMSQISAGTGTPAFGEGATGHKHVPSQIAEKARGKLAFVRVSGHSMAPTLMHEDYLIVEPMADMVPDAEVYVLRVDGEILVKRLARIAGDLSIKSDNPDYPTRHITKGDEVEVEIVAAVRGLQRASL